MNGEWEQTETGGLTRVVDGRSWHLYAAREGWVVTSPVWRNPIVVATVETPVEEAEMWADSFIAAATGVPAKEEPKTVEWCWVLTRRNFTNVYTDSGVLTASKGAKRSEILAALVSEAEEKSGVAGLAIEFLYLEREETT